MLCFFLFCFTSKIFFVQIGTQNSLEILEDPKAEVVDEIAAKLGLRKVRMMLDITRLLRGSEESHRQFSSALWGY